MVFVSAFCLGVDASGLTAVWPLFLCLVLLLLLLGQLQGCLVSVFGLGGDPSRSAVMWSLILAWC